MKLYELSVKRPIAVVMAVLVFVVLGVYSLSMLSMEMMPDMEMSMAVVYTSYGNVGSEEVENLVTKRIESAVSSVSGVSKITSQSSEGTSMLLVQFENGTDMDKAVRSMDDNIDLYSKMLPDGVEDPMIIRMDTSMMSAAMMSVSYEGYDLTQTKKFIDDNVVKKLESVEGVASVNVSGAMDRQIEVVIDPQKVFGYNMSLSDVVSAISAQNQNMPAGSIDAMNKSLPIKTEGKFEKIDDIKSVPLLTTTGQIIYLRDIADVKDSYSDASTYARLNDVDAISISITAESDANTVNVVEGVEKVLNDTVKKHPNFSYNMTMEQASYIKNSISSVAENAIVGCLLAIFILLLFLGSVRTSLTIGISMPISVITTFVGMYFSGMSLNIVSLGGLALGVGMLVDNSVVVLENIFRRRKEYNEGPQEAAIKGSKEVVAPVIASVLTTCIVYLPILFIDNLMAVMFKQLAFSIIFSQIASLLTTFLLLPMLSSKIDNIDKTDKKLDFILKPFTRCLDYLYKQYEKFLRFCLTHRKVTMIWVIIVFFVSLVLLSQLGMTLMPSSDEGNISVSVELPQGSKLDDTNDMCLNIEKIISKNENVKNVFSQVGSGGTASMFGGSSNNSASITVTLTENRKGSTEEIMQEIRESLEDITGATISLKSSSSAMSSMTSDGVDFQFTGDDDKQLEEAVTEAEKVLATIDGVKETSTSLTDKKSEVRVKLNPSRASMYGMNAVTAASLIKGVLSDTTASKLTENGTEYDIILKYPDNYVNNFNELKSLQLKTPIGKWITLSDIADVTIENGYSTLTRVDQKRVVTLSCKIFDTNMSEVNTKFTEAMNKKGIPNGVSFETSGTFTTMMDAMESLFIAILLGILLMYMVMAAQFESVSQPLIILGTVPLAIIGVVLSLVITWSPLSVIGCIGILMLGGIVVNNAIVLIDFVNTARSEKPDISRIDILVYAGKTRMRPILMTSLTSILGFLPMAISTASGSEMMRPLASVLVGGLLVGTLLTLFIIPVVYTWFDDRKIKRQNKKLKKA